MNRRNFIFLLAAILVLGALMITGRQESNEGKAAALLPGLDAKLNEINRLVIRTAGNRTAVTLVRGTERWTVAERNNYPANVGKIRDTLISLANAKVVEEKTADPTLYGRLGVEDISNEDATGVELAIDGPKRSWRIIVGRTGIRGKHAYARLPDAPVSLLISASPDLGTEPSDWLNREILDISADEIIHVTTTHPNGETFQIKRAESNTGGFELVGLPKDTELAYPGVIDAIGAVLDGLQLDDVVPRTDSAVQDIRPIVTRFETNDGLVITANSYETGDQTLVGFDVAASHQTGAPDDKATARAAKLDARLDQWLFELPGYKLEQLTRHMSDLVKKPKS